jgi:hypothetical protein
MITIQPGTVKLLAISYKPKETPAPSFANIKNKLETYVPKRLTKKVMIFPPKKSKFYYCEFWEK